MRLIKKTAIVNRVRVLPNWVAFLCIAATLFLAGRLMTAHDVGHRGFADPGLIFDQEITTDISEGCQCGEEKKARVAADTAAFSEKAARLVDDLNAYLSSLESGRMVVSATHRQVDQHVGQEIQSRLEIAAQQCHQRELSEQDVVSREGDLWRKSCASIAAGAEHYRAEVNAFVP